MALIAEHKASVYKIAANAAINQRNNSRMIQI